MTRESRSLGKEVTKMASHTSTEEPHSTGPVANPLTSVTKKVINGTDKEYWQKEI